ncbi:MAG: L-fucose/L-arabinose isomerase family protein [bacterium]
MKTKSYSIRGSKEIIKRIEFPRGRIGVFGIGLHAYWPQFAGLRERVLNSCDRFEEKVSKHGVEVVRGGFVDTSHRAFEVGDFFRTHPVDLLFCYVATYATSSVVVPVVQRAGVPIVLFGLQPTKKMNMKTATTFDQLHHDNITSLPEICGALHRCGRNPAGVVVGTLDDDPRADREIEEWCRVADVARSLRNARIGHLGHTYEGMLDMHSDPTMFHSFFGMHIEELEMCDLREMVEAVGRNEIERMKDEIRRIFHFADPGADPIAGPVKAEDLDWSAQVSVALHRLVEEHGLTGLAYYYRGLGGNIYERIIAGMIVGSSILTGSGVPIAGEADIKTCVAMLIMDRLGAGGSFAEFHPADFDDDIILVGHDGPAHIRISDERPILRSLSVYHGKRGFGLSVEFKVKTGKVTMLGLTQTHEGRFKMVVGTGESLPGPIPATGNTNTRVRFASGVADFVERWSMEGPTHHFALGVGDCTSMLEKVSKVFDVDITVVK